MSEELDNVKNHAGCEHDECGCGCGHDCDEEVPMVYYEREDGTEVGLPIVDSFEYKDVEYVVVEDEDQESSYIFTVVENDGEETLEPIDDANFDEVADYYESLLALDEDEDEEEEDEEDGDDDDDE